MVKIRDIKKTIDNPTKNTESRMDIWPHLGPNSKSCSGAGDYPDKFITVGMASFYRYIDSNIGSGGGLGRIANGDAHDQ